MIFCKKCGGRMMVDDTYSGERAYEVYCLMCGHRKSAHKEKNAFGRWLKARGI